MRISDPEIGMNGFIAVHSTLCGPSLGGLRIRNYPSEDHALKDVMKLAEAMTYKAAAAGLPFGGGKAVLVGEAESLKTSRLLQHFGRVVE